MVELARRLREVGVDPDAENACARAVLSCVTG